MTLAECGELKKRLVAEKNLAAVDDYFFSQFAGPSTFLSIGRELPKERGTVLVKTLGQAYSHISNEPLLSIEVQFVEVPQYHLIHGPVIVNGKRGSILFFEDLGICLFTLVWNPGAGEIKYMRFVIRKPETTQPN